MIAADKSDDDDVQRDGTIEPIQINLLDDTASGDLDDPSQTCGGRKRIFSQSDAAFDQENNDRKKINPFSSALSAAPYYYHDFKVKSNDKAHQDKNPICAN